MAPKAAPKAVKAPAKGSASAGKASKASKTPATTRKNGDTKPEPKSTTKKTAEKATKAPAASKKPAVKPNTKAKAVEKMTTTGKKSQEKGTKASATTQKNGITKPTLKSRATAKMSAEKATKALTASKKPTQNPTTKANIPATTSKKRRHNDDDDSEDKEAPPPPPPAKKARITKQPAAKPKINKAPTQILDVFVAGEGSAGELGLGSAKGVIDVKRPRLNPLLSKKEVGVVQVACGGMHMAALTHDNKILTWGVNDVGALGRETTWAGGLKSIDDDDKSVDSDDEDSGLNPLESTPTAIPASSFSDGTTFVKVSAGDSHTLALTDEGLVYGWGQFRVSNFMIAVSIRLWTHTNTLTENRWSSGFPARLRFFERDDPSSFARPNQNHQHHQRCEPRHGHGQQRRRIHLGRWGAEPARIPCRTAYGLGEQKDLSQTPTATHKNQEVPGHLHRIGPLLRH